MDVQIWITGPFEIINRALALLLNRLPGVACVGQSVDLEDLPDSQLDLVLWFTPQSINLKTLILFCERHPSLKVLLLSMQWAPAQAKDALQAGAAGCLAVDSSIGELAAALRQAVRGEIALNASLQRAIILEFANQQSAATPSFTDLSSREREILALICDGLSNKQIAQRLYLSVRTVENHLARLYDKLEVSSRTEAAILALRQGWVKTQPDH